LPKARSHKAKAIIEPVIAADAASKMRSAADSREPKMVMLLIRRWEI
jgi:hypothetical protein